ncbi:hypothetical protein R3P38DRAFT_3479630 [Favolaschia claudopus]|uniref:Uncharacterized protein n=1 Tax=Favolaschia claudopus TaxID=2862362 RepID=A0AAV9Z937_9AGAR
MKIRRWQKAVLTRPPMRDGRELRESKSGKGARHCTRHYSPRDASFRPSFRSLRPAVAHQLNIDSLCRATCSSPLPHPYPQPLHPPQPITGHPLPAIRHLRRLASHLPTTRTFLTASFYIDIDIASPCPASHPLPLCSRQRTAPPPPPPRLCHGWAVWRKRGDVGARRGSRWMWKWRSAWTIVARQKRVVLIMLEGRRRRWERRWCTAREKGETVDVELRVERDPERRRDPPHLYVTVHAPTEQSRWSQKLYRPSANGYFQTRSGRDGAEKAEEKIDGSRRDGQNIGSKCIGEIRIHLPRVLLIPLSLIPPSHRSSSFFTPPRPPPSISPHPQPHSPPPPPGTRERRRTVNRPQQASADDTRAPAPIRVRGTHPPHLLSLAHPTPELRLESMTLIIPTTTPSGHVCPEVDDGGSVRGGKSVAGERGSCALVDGRRDEGGGSGVKKGAVSVREGGRGRNTGPASTRSTGEDVPDVRCRHGSVIQSTASSSQPYRLARALLLLLPLPVLPTDPPTSSSSSSSLSIAASLSPPTPDPSHRPSRHRAPPAASFHTGALDLGVMIDDPPPSFHLISDDPPPRHHWLAASSRRSTDWTDAAYQAAAYRRRDSSSIAAVLPKEVRNGYDEGERVEVSEAATRKKMQADAGDEIVGG